MEIAEADWECRSVGPGYAEASPDAGADAIARLDAAPAVLDDLLARWTEVP